MVVVSVYFDFFCSDIIIVVFGNDWLINCRNFLDIVSWEDIVIEIMDYDVDNFKLDEIYLEYCCIGDGIDWIIIFFIELKLQYIVNRDVLISYNIEEFGLGVLLVFFFIWDIMSEYQKYLDGIYEIRVIVVCGIDGVVLLNIIRGQIWCQIGEVFVFFEFLDLVW